MTNDIPPLLRNSWRAQAPSITDAEIAALVRVTRDGGSPVVRMLRAYRAGVRAATPAERPLSGFEAACPTCESVHVAAILWQVKSRPLLDGTSITDTVMWARCYDDQTIYRPATGEVWTQDPETLSEDLRPTTTEDVPHHG